MTDNPSVIWAIAVMALITAALRFIPFLIFGGKRKTPEVISELGSILPYAVMAMLVVYCMKTVKFSDVSGFAPELIAAALVVGLHVWRRNVLISIVGGTICYMLLVQFVFV